MFDSLVQKFKIVDACAGCVTTNGGVTSDYVSMKNVHKAWVVINLKQAVGHATAITLKEAADVSGTSVATVANAQLVWSNLDTTATDTLVARTAATGYTVSTAAKPMHIVFEIDPAKLTDGLDCIAFTVADSSQATNFVSGNFILATRYPQATPPAAITD